MSEWEGRALSGGRGGSVLVCEMVAKRDLILLILETKEWSQLREGKVADCGRGGWQG